MNYLPVLVKPEKNCIDKRIQRITLHLRTFSPKLRIFTSGLQQSLSKIRNWEVFLHMSDEQFDTFLAFLTEINTANILIRFNKGHPEKDHFSWLKILSLCAVFPNLMNCAIVLAIKKCLISGVVNPSQLFTELFDQYDISNDFIISKSELENYIYDNFSHCLFDIGNIHQELDLYESYDDFFVLLAIKNGYNIRSVNPTGFSISKKESFYFHQQHNLLKFQKNTNYMKQRLVASKLAKYLVDDFRILQKYLDASRLFNADIAAYYSYFSTWKKAFLLLLAADYRENEVTTYVDFIEFQLQNDAHFSLQGTTYKRILERALAWHESITYKQAKGENLWWGKPEDEEVRIIQYQQKEYGYSQILNSLDLFLEGKNNHHCVYTYLDACVEKRIQIWKLFAVDTTQHITLEVRNKKIVQALGKYNKPDPFLEKVILPIMAKQENLLINVSSFSLL